MANSYFTPELFQFLAQLKRNNRREWFLRNKPRYDAVVRDACLRFITDLERIGDLIWWIAQRLKNSKPKLQTRDTEALAGMARHIASMLEAVHQGLLNGDTSMAQAVIVRDRDIDELRQQVFRFHLDHKRQENTRESIEILFMTQALERAGDHATNLAEELIHLHE